MKGRRCRPLQRLRVLWFTVVTWSILCLLCFEPSLPLLISESPIHQLVSSSGASNRFPLYNSPAFAVQCPWIPRKSRKTRNCTILARPSPKTGEGMSNWLCQIASGHIMAVQSGCRFLLDYGPTVKVTQAIQPQKDLDWRVPADYDCDADPTCLFAEDTYTDNSKPMQQVQLLSGQSHLAPIPGFRIAYKSRIDPTISNYLLLNQTLPGLILQTAFACSLGSLLDIRGDNIERSFHQPNLSKLLAHLRSSKSRVLTLYIRTGQTDENIGLDQHRLAAEPIVECALQLEESHKSHTWLVISDSQYVKTWVTASYTQQGKRQIITTQSHGKQTKPTTNPSTTDFVEAFLDWYLLGESDLVIGSGPSFGDTGALRTARPFYRVVKDSNGTCQQVDAFPTGSIGSLNFFLGHLHKR